MQLQLFDDNYPCEQVMGLERIHNDVIAVCLAVLISRYNYRSDNCPRAHKKLFYLQLAPSGDCKASVDFLQVPCRPAHSILRISAKNGRLKTFFQFFREF